MSRFFKKQLDKGLKNDEHSRIVNMKLTSISLGMSHVQSRSAGIGEHIKHVLFLLCTFYNRSIGKCGTTLRRTKCPMVLPIFLPFRFDRCKWINPRCWRRGVDDDVGRSGVFLLSFDGTHITSNCSSSHGALTHNAANASSADSGRRTECLYHDHTNSGRDHRHPQEMLEFHPRDQ